MPLPSPAALGLPPKPVTASYPVGHLGTVQPALPVAGPSRTSSCTFCDNEAKYTCPRCAVRTCSLACSRAHKDRSGCSGMRDPAAYVPLNAYGQGTWDGDYAWLEDGRRKVVAWGEGISAEDIGGNSGQNGRGGKVGRGGRGGGRGGAKAPLKRSKLDGLKWAISEIGCDIDFVPEGMQRRRINQSSWNPKSRSLNLTIHLVVSGSLGDQVSPEMSLVTHPRVSVPMPPISTLTSKPPTLLSLIPPGLVKEKPILVMPYYMPRRRVFLDTAPQPSRPTKGIFFPPLDYQTPIANALRGTAWVEFPVIHLFKSEEWEQALHAGDIAVLPLFDSKRKLNVEDREQEDDNDSGSGPRKKMMTDELLGVAAYISDDEVGSAVAETAVDNDVGHMESDEGKLDGYDDKNDSEDDSNSVGDLTLPPEMAAALGRALEADFGENTEAL